MDNQKKIEVCAYCSGLGPEEIKELKRTYKAKIGCVGKCSKKCPELQGKVFGFLNGEFTVCDTKDAFFAKVGALGAYQKTTDQNPLVDGFLSTETKWRAEFEALRGIVLACGLTEELKWGQPCYTCQNSNVLILGGFKEYIALSFFKGALLTDPQGLLVQQTENVQSARQLRFTATEEIARMEPVIQAYVEEAIAVEKAGLAVPAEKKPELAIPEELEARFRENPALKSAFFALTPGRQRGYLFHFLQPKQSKTREARIDKHTERILQGLGIDD